MDDDLLAFYFLCLQGDEARSESSQHRESISDFQRQNVTFENQLGQQ